MKNFKKYLIGHHSTIREAMKQINDLSGEGLFVVDDELRLKGAVTDGDIRRSLISGHSLEDEVNVAMNSEAFQIKNDQAAQCSIKELSQRKLKSAPIVNEMGVVVEIFHLEVGTKLIENQVVIMAGGLGSRLGDLTKDKPKPMLEVGGEPILQKIIKRLTSEGFYNILISVNYKADLIENHFQDGANYNCKIEYLRETTRLGTAGALSLLKTNNLPFLVMNGDLLTQVDIFQMIRFHEESHSVITMGVRNYEFQVPFGVVKTSDGRVVSFEEKPTVKESVNAGIYVINPSVLKDVPSGEYFDMSTLLNRSLAKNDLINCFPIVESWIDVGRITDLDYARSVYSESV